MARELRSGDIVYISLGEVKQYSVISINLESQPATIRIRSIDNSSDVVLEHNEGKWTVSGSDQPYNIVFVRAGGQIRLIDLVALLPGRGWDWDRLSSNRNITIQDVANHPKFPWNRRDLSANPNTTLQTVLDNPEPWYRKPFLKERDRWNWSALSSSSGITFQEIISHPNLPWNYDSSAQNKTITAQDFIDNYDLLTKNSYIYDINSGLSENRGIKPKDVLDHPQIRWYWEYIPGYRYLTKQDVIENSEYQQYWSRNPVFEDFTIQDVIDHPEVGWDPLWVLKNPGVTVKDVDFFGGPTPKNMRSLSLNPGTTIQDVVENPDLPWVWYLLTTNPGIKVKDIMDHPELPWAMRSIYRNPEITIEDLVMYGDLLFENNVEVPTITARETAGSALEIADNMGLANNKEYLSENAGLVPQDVLDNPNIPWNWKALSNNEFIGDRPKEIISEELIFIPKQIHAKPTEIR